MIRKMKEEDLNSMKIMVLNCHKELFVCIASKT